MQEAKEAKEDLLEHVRFLKRIYTLDDACPIPTNTKFILNRISELLDLAGTNSIYFAPISVKMVALGYVLMLISHCVDVPSLGFTVFDPQSQLWLASGKSKDELGKLEQFALLVKDFLDKIEVKDEEKAQH